MSTKSTVSGGASNGRSTKSSDGALTTGDAPLELNPLAYPTLYPNREATRTWRYGDDNGACGNTTDVAWTIELK
jgi:hypothetical protein